MHVRPHRDSLRVLLTALLLGAVGGCGETPEDTSWVAQYYATHVESFEAGENAGFGQAEFPDVVLGPPQGQGTARGGLDVLSLGVGGTIVIGFEGMAITNGEGPDFIVFENAFWAGNDPAQVWADPAEVSVSDDGVSWTAFPCEPDLENTTTLEGCAGWQPVLSFESTVVVPLDPALTGGDAFDLSTIGLERAKYIRIRDLATDGGSPSAGFDLDAVGLIHSQPLN